MGNLHLPDNIKVHFAGVEESNYSFVLTKMGIRYGLYSAFKFVKKKCFGKNIITEKDEVLMNFLRNSFSHVIQDSGLYSLLFGNFKGCFDKKDIYKWYDSLVEWTLDFGQNFTCVEVDAQSIIGVEETWNLRKQMQKDLPNNQIINVWHLPDGKIGLDRMIEFSDYIAIGVPELKLHGLFGYVYPLANYIKERKPDIDIHLLGCTDYPTIKKCNFCTSCDSTTWLDLAKFGEIQNYHLKNLDTLKCEEFIGKNVWDSIREKYKGKNILPLTVGIEEKKRLYQIYAGNQDYTI